MVIIDVQGIVGHLLDIFYEEVELADREAAVPRLFLGGMYGGRLGQEV